MEAKGSAGEEPDAGVDGFDEGVGEAVLERDKDRVEMVGDGVAEALEGFDLGIPGPLQPLLEEGDRVKVNGMPRPPVFGR